MSDFLFGRTASAKIGKAGTTGVLVDGLRIAFNITKTAKPDSNKCTVEISNLSKTTRDQLKANTGILVELSVGYEEMSGGNEVIFIGDIVNVDHDTTNPDILTTLEVADGYGAIKGKRSSVSYKAGATLRTIITEAVKNLGLAEKTRINDIIIPSVVYKNGFSYEGYTAGLLNKLCHANGLNWSVQNNEIKIYAQSGDDGSASLRAALINSPRRILKKAKDGSSTDSFSGWELDTLLAPKAEPGGVITLETETITPAVKAKIVEVKHVGDTHGAQWMSTIKAEDKT